MSGQLKPETKTANHFFLRFGRTGTGSGIGSSARMTSFRRRDVWDFCDGGVDSVSDGGEEESKRELGRDNGAVLGVDSDA